MQTITMNQGKATLPPVATPEPSLAEQAARLELFEIAQLRYRIEALQHEIAGWKGRLHAAESANNGELEQKVADLQAQLTGEAAKYKALKAEAVDNEQQLEKLNYFVKELKDGGDALGAERDKLQDECRKQAINRTTAERKLADAQARNAVLEKQVKELKKLDPERLQKQVKNLKKDNKEKQDAIDQLRVNNKKLTLDNRRKASAVSELNKAVDSAADQVNSQNKLEPIEEHDLGKLGIWAVYNSLTPESYEVVDRTNNVGYGVTVQDGQIVLPKVRKIPKGLQQTLLARWVHYQNQERAIAHTEQPLNV